MKNSKVKKYIMILSPLFELIALIIAFLIIGTMRDINISYGLKCIVNQ